MIEDPIGLTYRGPGGWPENVNYWRTGFSDGHVEITNVIDGGDIVAVEYIGSGTNTGTLVTPDGDLPPTGEHIVSRFVNVWEFREGKIIRGRSYVGGLMASSGVPPDAMINPHKRLTAARLAGVPELESAFVDVTDTKDIWDGGGLKPPSVGPPVALLQESLLAMGYPLPRGGADGRYGAETTAAVVRFQVDAGHPWPSGQAWEHIGGIAGANTMAHFDMFDPGGTVSSHVEEVTGVPARSATFAESPDHPFAGFDAGTTPVSLVVGTASRRRVRVNRAPARGDLTYLVVDPSIATIGTTQEGLVVGGIRAGTTLVRAMAGATVLTELEVHVRDPREEVVNFFFVGRGTGAVTPTLRDREQATLLTLRLNRVFRRQANVHFTCGQERDIVLDDPHDTGFVVPGQLNVVCAGAWPGDVGVADPSVLLVPDDDAADGMTVPRGAALFLGATLAAAPDGLMAQPGRGADRRRVPRTLADVVNPPREA